MTLPNNGRILVIDNDLDEGKPLIDALTTSGHLATFIEPECLPPSPFKGIRVVFLDLFLTRDDQSQKSRISTILGVMNAVIDKKRNGPFFLVIWTKHKDEAEAVENALWTDGFLLVASMMEKGQCKEDGQFSTAHIKRQMDAAFAKGAALKMFTLWENHVHAAAGEIVSRFSSFGGQSDAWSERMDLVVAKLAQSTLGEHFDPDQPAAAIESAMYSLSSALAGAIRQQTRGSSELAEIDMSLPDAGKNKKLKVLMDGQINSALLLKPTTVRHAIPGNVYKNTVGNVDPAKLVHKAPADLSGVEHIMLEVTPLCDYAEKKMLKNRLLPGVVFPHEHYGSLKKHADFLAISPVLEKSKRLFHFVFDLRLFTSVDADTMLYTKPIFAIQNDLLADIQSKLSNHINRLGVASV